MGEDATSAEEQSEAENVRVAEIIDGDRRQFCHGI